MMLRGSAPVPLLQKYPAGHGSVHGTCRPLSYAIVPPLQLYRTPPTQY
jgi:hypothetical protein